MSLPYALYLFFFRVRKTGRSLYAKYGSKICNVLIAGASGAALCYFTAAVTNNALMGLFACAFTGFCTSVLWPGSLIVASGKYEYSGVFIYALMAAGGDLGASVAPQLVGIVSLSGVIRTGF